MALTGEAVGKALERIWPTRGSRVAAGVLSVMAAGLVVFVFKNADWAGRIAGRVAKGKKPRLEDFIYDGQWHAAVVSAGVFLVLAALARFWTVAPPRPVAEARPAAGGWRPWLFWGLMGAVLIGAALVRVPRLSLSLYNDEEYTFRRYVAGEHKHMPDGTREWRPVSWLGTLWGSQMANNGVPYSLAARACYDWAVKTGRAVATLPAEVPLRVPALVAGLGSIVVMALLARHLGGAGAGVLAAVLAALHPWHVRYSTEARGHSFVLLLAPLLPLALARAVETGRRRWWVVFGAAEVGLLWSFAGSVYYVFAFNVLALVWLWRRGGSAWRTFVAVHALAAVVFIQLIAPCFPQIRAALAENDVFSAGISRAWFANTGSFLFAGMPWENANPGMPDHPSMGRAWDAGWAPVLWCLGWITLAMACALGRVGRSLVGWPLALSLPLAAVLAVTVTFIGKSVLFSWYVLYLLPGGLVLVAVGLSEWLRSTSRGASRRLRPTKAVLSAVPVFIVILMWLQVIARPLVTYLSTGKQALREVARFVREPVDGVEPLAVLHATEAGTYDPTLEFIDADVTALRRWMARSDAENRPLVVAFGYRTVVARTHPDFLRAIEESGDFDKVATFPGLEEPQFAHFVWRHSPKPGAAGGVGGR